MKRKASPAASRAKKTKLKYEWDEHFETVVDNETLLWLRKKSQSRKRRNFNAEDFLTSFVNPLQVEGDFYNTVFHQRALAITGLSDDHTRGLLKEHFFNGDPKKLIRYTASAEQGVSVWVPKKDTGEIQSYKSQDRKLTLSLFENAGASLYMRAPRSTCDFLPRQAFKSLGMPFCTYPDGAVRGEVEVFIASQNSRRTPTHTDFQENFTFQLIGKKVWRLHLGDVKNPIRAKSPHFANTPLSVVETQLLASQACGGSPKMDPPADSSPGWIDVELGPGDLLYHPPGIWHNVQVTELDSSGKHRQQICMNANVSLVTPTWADLFSDAIRQSLWRDDVLRRPVQIKDTLTATTAFQYAISQSVLNKLTWQHLVPPLFIRSPDLYTKSGLEFKHAAELAPELSSKERFKRNTLALVLFDMDMGDFLAYANANEDEADEEEEDEEDEDEEEDRKPSDVEAFSCVIHVNLGNPDLESSLRCEIWDVPIHLLPLCEHIRDSEIILCSTLWQLCKTDVNPKGVALDVLKVMVDSGVLIPLD